MNPKSKSHLGKRLNAFPSIRVMVSAAFLVALSIVCGKYLAIRGGDILRFSFENMPILFSGIVFGPVVGVIVGVAGDLLGCVMVAYAINPIVTLGAAVIGFVGGIVFRIPVKLPLAVRLLLSVFTAHFLGSVIVKTFGLAQFYDMPFFVLMLWRALNYLIIGALEYAILYALMKSKALRKQIGKITGNNPHKHDPNL